MRGKLIVRKIIEYAHIYPQGTFLVDYAQSVPSCRDFFHFSQDEIIAKIEHLDRQSFPHRPALQKYLLDYHSRLKAPEAVMKNIQALGDPRTLVIMTGQQPGLLTGPLYTILKAVSAIKKAQEMQQQLGRVCVPVFWMATEDHHLEEVISVYLPQPDQSEYQKISMPPWRGHFKKPAGHLPLPQERYALFMEKIDSCLPLSNQWPKIESIINSAFIKSVDWGEWFAHLMLSFFGSSGLVLVEPNQTHLKALAQPLWDRIILHPLSLSKLVDESGTLLTKLGYRCQLKQSNSACPFFLYENGRRERVTWEDNQFHTQKASYSKDQMRELIKESPERISPNVYVRPIFSEFLFPTLLYLAGPGEIGYLAQIKQIYEFFHLLMPIVMPRLSLTFFDQRVTGQMSSASVGFDTFLQERKVNIFYFLNYYGLDFISALLSFPRQDYYYHYLTEITE